MADDCQLCARHRGAGPLAAPLVWEDDLVLVHHTPASSERTFLGHLIVESRRHAVHLDGLTADEAAAVGRAVRIAAVGLSAELDVELAHSAVINRRMEHFHQHVMARHRGTPDDFEWHRVDEWPGAPSGDAAEVTRLCDRLRGYF